MSLSQLISGFFASTTSSQSQLAKGAAGVGGDAVNRMDVTEEGKRRPPIVYSMIAGGIGGCTGDMLMHSLDTVKTRQQGAPHVSKYASTSLAYRTIFREEGVRRGLYGGVAPAFIGSLPGTVIFFGTYEWSKRWLLGVGCPEHLAYLTGGFLGDLFASVIYVPTEVLKTRLQLQGRYNNPHFISGYNYRSTLHAARTIVATEGASALFYGYKATLMRDLPFSALQFAFYEQFQKWAKAHRGPEIGVGYEILTGAAAGGLAGAITCPLDVVKTRVQTEVRTPEAPAKPVEALPVHKPHASGPLQQVRTIATIPNTSATTSPTTEKLRTSSILRGLALILKSEGIGGWFRGVGPRFVWTSVQSGTMLVMYQVLLKRICHWAGEDDVDIESAGL